MKKLLFLFLFLPGLSYSQNVPTPGFEDWYIGNVIQRPQGWITSNIYSVAQFGIYSVEPDWENFIQGNLSCKLSTYQEHPDSMPHAAFITNGQPQMDYETLTVDFISGGTPFPYKPAKMLAFYKYHSNTPLEDFGQAKVILKKYNEATGKRDTIGIGTHLLLNPAQDFTLFEVPIEYIIPNVTPDSIVVIFHSTYPDFPIAGSELWLDSLHFDISTGIEEVERVERVEKVGYFLVSPNPTKDRIFIEILFPYSGLLKLFASEGKLIYSERIDEDQKSLEIEVAGILPGLYFLQLSNENGEAIQTKKVIIY